MTQIPDAAVQAAEEAVYTRHERGFLMKPLVEPVDMRKALTAAMPHLPLGFEVEQLVWSEYDDEQGAPDRWDAEAASFGVFYSIELQHDSFRVVFDHEAVGAIGAFHTIDEAKAAAQADFERRVRECLVAKGVGELSDDQEWDLEQRAFHFSERTPFKDGRNLVEDLWRAYCDLQTVLHSTKPVDVEAVRRQAFEEAATLIDEGFDKPVGKAWRNDGKASKNDKCPHDQYMYEDCEPCAANAIRAISAEPAQGDTIDDGRPCSMDEFMAALFDERADALDIKEAAEAWIEGDWKYALAYLVNVPEHWRPLPAAPTAEAEA